MDKIANNINFPPSLISILQPMSQPQSLAELIKELPLKQRIPAAALYKVYGQRQAVDTEQEESISRIKLSYHQKLKPLLQRASEIIRGAPLKEEQLVNAKDFLKPNENIKNYMKGKVIDNYWNSVLSNSPLVNEITEEDEKALNYLLDIQNIFPENSKENNNISLKFVFKENPYFHETTLVRHLRVQGNEKLAIEGDQITWKEGKWLTHERKKITNKKTGESKIDKGKKIKSFFDIFLDWNAEKPAELNVVGDIILELANLIVMDSLDYFLDLINEEERSIDQDDEEDYDDEQQMDGSKKVKQ